MLRLRASIQGLVVVVTTAVAVLPAQAADIEDRNYDKAVELHQREHFQAAAARFMASYDIGHRQQASAYNAACALARAGLTDEAFQWLMLFFISQLAVIALGALPLHWWRSFRGNPPSDGGPTGGAGPATPAKAGASAT